MTKHYIDKKKFVLILFCSNSVKNYAYDDSIKMKQWFDCRTVHCKWTVRRWNRCVELKLFPFGTVILLAKVVPTGWEETPLFSIYMSWSCTKLTVCYCCFLCLSFIFNRFPVLFFICDGKCSCLQYRLLFVAISSCYC